MAGRWRKALLVGVAALATLVALIAIGWPFLPWNRLEATLAARVEAAIGRQLIVGGPISMALFPRPVLSAGNIVVTNSDAGAPRAEMIEVERVLLEVDPWAFVTGRLVIEKMVLEAPRIHLVRFADGTANWSFVGQLDTDAEPEGTPARPMAALVRDIEIIDGTVTYLDTGSGLARQVDQVNAMVFAETLTGPFRADGDLVYGTARWGFEIALDALIEDRGVPATLHFAGLGASVDFAGVLSGYPDRPRLAGSISGRSENAAALLLSVGLDLPELTWDEARRQDEEPDADADPDLGADRRAVFDAVVSATEQSLDLEHVTARVGPVVMRGALEVTFSELPRAEAIIAVDSMDLAQAGAAVRAAMLTALVGAAVEPPVSLGDLARRHFVPRADFDVAIEATFGELVFKGVSFDDVVLSVDLASRAGGSLSVELDLRFLGAEALALAGIDPSADRQASLFALAMPFNGLAIESGQMSGEIHLSATGATPAELVETIAGEVAFEYQDLVLGGFDPCELGVPSTAEETATGVPDRETARYPATLMAPFTLRFELVGAVATVVGNDISAECATAELTGRVDLDAGTSDLAGRVDFTDDALAGLEFVQQGSIGTAELRLGNRAALEWLADGDGLADQSLPQEAPERSAPAIPNP